MSDVDVVFLHPPSNYDFRDRAFLFGPISDLPPSTPVFEMYPIGFIALCDHLEKAGFSTRIIDIANKMLASRRYDPARAIQRLRAKAFAIDLYWLPHVQGNLKMGELVKKIHPHCPIIYGGYSATYFSEELIRHPFVDYVVRGDSTDFPMVILMDAVLGKGAFGQVPNLTYKDETGQILTNNFNHVAADIDDLIVDYGLMARRALRHLDPDAYLPLRSWKNYPITAVFPFRGCRHDCVTCGGSKTAGERVFRRSALAVKSPETVAAELAKIDKYFDAPVMIIGDIQQKDRDYALRLLREIKPRPAVQHGLIDENIAEDVAGRARRARNLHRSIVELIDQGRQNSPAWTRLMHELRSDFLGSISYEEELEWPTGLTRFKIMALLSRLFVRS